MGKQNFNRIYPNTTTTGWKKKKKKEIIWRRTAIDSTAFGI